MPQGGWLYETLREAWGDLTLLLVVGLVLAAAIRSRGTRATRSRASMRGTIFFLLLHVLSLPLLGYLAAGGHESYHTWRLLSITFATFAGVTIILAILFDGVLRALRFEVPRLMQDVIAATAYLVSGFFLLSAWGVNLGGLIATSAVLTAVIGFSLQDTLGNLMGGMALQMERSIRPGDWIQVGDKTGRVLEVRWRQTTIETRDWETVVVPNSILAKNQFVVLGKRFGEPVQLRRWIHFQIDYRFDPTEIMRAVEEALRKAPIEGVAMTPAPDCLLTDVRGSNLSMAARYFLTDLNRDAPVDTVVRNRVVVALKRAGVPLGVPAQAIFFSSAEERRQHRDRQVEEGRERVLRNTELFKNLSDGDLKALTEGLRYSPFSTGEVLTRQGSEGHDLYVIQKGQIAIRVAANGKETEVAQLGPGAFFGERSLMTGEVRSATTVAMTDVVCYRLPKAELQGLLKRRPELAEELAEILARRENELDARRQHLTNQAREQCIEQDRRQLVSKIRNFFGL